MSQSLGIQQTRPLVPAASEATLVTVFKFVDVSS